MAEEKLPCKVLLTNDMELDFGDVRWELSGESLKLFDDEATLLIAEFPREAVCGIWRELYSITEP